MKEFKEMFWQIATIGLLIGGFALIGYLVKHLQ
jgi:uncharacterized membrane-anchored protein YhcB (DUF1043 family)